MDDKTQAEGEASAEREAWHSAAGEREAWHDVTAEEADDDAASGRAIWTGIIAGAIGAAVVGVIAHQVVRHYVPAKKRPTARPSARRAAPPPPAADTAAIEDARAALLLGVSVDATADEIRAAYRRCVTERLRAGAGFGDQAGDPEETRALNDAKNRLMERARRWERAP